MEREREAHFFYMINENQSSCVETAFEQFSTLDVSYGYE